MTDFIAWHASCYACTRVCHLVGWVRPIGLCGMKKYRQCLSLSCHNLDKAKACRPSTLNLTHHANTCRHCFLCRRGHRSLLVRVRVRRGSVTMQPIILLSLYAASGLSVTGTVGAIVCHLTADHGTLIAKAAQRRERGRVIAFCLLWPIACFVALPIAAMVGAILTRGV